MANCIELENVGIVLEEEFMKPFNLSQNALAKAINVPVNRIHYILKGNRGISVDTDLRLTKLFGLSEGYFLRIQEEYETRRIKQHIGKELNNIIPLTYQPKACVPVQNSNQNTKIYKRG
jgi:addiction module HigA family antidote